MKRMDLESPEPLKRDATPGVQRRPGRLWIATFVSWTLFFITVTQLQVPGPLGSALFVIACLLLVISPLETAGWVWSMEKRTVSSLAALWAGGVFATMVLALYPILSLVAVILLGVLLVTTAQWLGKPRAK